MSARYVSALGAPRVGAALVGGATDTVRRCRGRSLLISATVCTAFWLIAAGSVAAQGTDAASPEDTLVIAETVEASHFDIIAEPPLWRVRYLVPALEDIGLSYADLANEMELLCQIDALPRVVAEGAAPERIVMTLMAAPVEFGVMTPEIRQFFESFKVENGLCIWEAF